MASHDLISKSLILSWGTAGYSSLMPSSRIYYGRPQKPNQLAGFPYAELDISLINREIVTNIAVSFALCTYELSVKIYTVQGMTGGMSVGDQVVDQSNLQRALENILDHIPPNTPWNYVVNFLHCLQVPPNRLTKDPELYLGADVMVSTNTWNLLIEE